jgi:hypothetical protein
VSIPTTAADARWHRNYQERLVACQRRMFTSSMSLTLPVGVLMSLGPGAWVFTWLRMRPTRRRALYVSLVLVLWGAFLLWMIYRA